MSTEIMEDLRGENNNAFMHLYAEYFGMVNRFVTGNGGSAQDAEDVFQDTMLVILEKLRRDDFVLTASLKTYTMAIAKNIWLKRLRTSDREVEFTELHNDKFYEEINEAIEEEKSYRDKLQNLLHKITEHCKGLIHDMFFNEKPIEKIRKEYGYTTIHNAQNQKHKCVEQLRKARQAGEKRKA